MGSLSKGKKKNIPKSINEMSKEMLQETLKKKRECNAKALETVEKLCESNVNEEWFLENLQFINQTHFDDVTVERAISKMCGYPLCGEKLQKIPSQQYHISTRYNKVFDITERKNFCSSTCFKASKYVKDQLFTSPLWFRDQEVIPKYVVMKSSKSSLGDEVVFLPDKIKPEPDDVKKQTDAEEMKKLEEECSKISIHDNQPSNKGVDRGDVNEVLKETTTEGVGDSDKRNNNKENERTTVGNNVCEVDNKKVNNSIKKSDVTSHIQERNTSQTFEKLKPKTVIEPSRRDEIKKEPINPISKIESAIFEWFSLDTMFYLYEEKKLKELLKDQTDVLQEILKSKPLPIGGNDRIEKMIQLFGLLDADALSNDPVRTNLKPLPDYSALKEEGKNLEIKVRAFYKGQLEIKKSESEESKPEEKESTNENETNPIYLPLIDSHAQLALRRKIVLDKLNRILPEIVRAFTRDYTLQMSDVRNLVSTFSLSAHNITFKPGEWCLVGLILIKMLSLKDRHLKVILLLAPTQDQVAVLLKNYQLKRDYLEDLINRLTHSSNLLKKLTDVDR